MELEKFDDPGTHDYVDKTVRPDTVYRYKLTSRARQTDRDVPFPNPEESSKEKEVRIPFNMEFDTVGMFPSGDWDDLNTKLWVDVIYKQPGGKEIKVKLRRLKRGDPIIIEGIQTGWKIKDFGEKKLSPTKREKFIVIIDAAGRKTIRFPRKESDLPKSPDEPEKPETPKDPEAPETPGDASPEEPENGENGETPPRDPGGGWLPPRR